MAKSKSVNVVIGANGTVRVYADGGMVFEITGDYVKLETYVDSQSQAPSGEVKKGTKD